MFPATADASIVIRMEMSQEEILGRRPVYMIYSYDCTNVRSEKGK